jgi:hypothetical protein
MSASKEPPIGGDAKLSVGSGNRAILSNSEGRVRPDGATAPRDRKKPSNAMDGVLVEGLR